MAGPGQFIDGWDLRSFYNTEVVQWIRNNYPMEFSRNTKLFTDAPAAAWTNFFTSDDTKNVTGIFDSLNDALAQARALDRPNLITARGVVDAFAGHAALTLTRFRLIGSTRTVTATAGRVSTSERRTGRAGRLLNQWRAPGFSAPNPASFVTTSSNLVVYNNLLNYFSAMRDEWVRVAGATTANFELNFSVCHNSCHNQCHGSRGRR